VIDKSKREDGTFSREDFTFDKDRNVYICPANKILTTTGKLVNDGRHFSIGQKRATVVVARSRHNGCPKTSVRKIRAVLRGSSRRCPGAGQDGGVQALSRDRKRVEMLLRALEAYLRLSRLRLRGPCGAQFEFTLAAIAQNLRRLAKLVARPPPVRPFVRCVSVASVSKVELQSPAQSSG